MAIPNPFRRLKASSSSLDDLSSELGRLDRIRLDAQNLLHDLGARRPALLVDGTDAELAKLDSEMAAAAEPWSRLKPDGPDRAPNGVRPTRGRPRPRTSPPGPSAIAAAVKAPGRGRQALGLLRNRRTGPRGQAPPAGRD